MSFSYNLLITEKKNAFFNFNFKLVFVLIKFAFFRDLSRDERGGTDDARVNFLTEINSNSKIKSSIDKNHDLTPDNDGSLFKLVEFMILIVQFILCLTKNKMAFCHHNITVLKQQCFYKKNFNVYSLVLF